MKPEAITFDVAATLVDVQWDPARVIEAAAEKIGVEVTPCAGDTYAAAYVRRLPAFHEANQESDAAVKAFWLRLDTDWLVENESDPKLAEVLYEAGWDILFGPDSQVFRPCPDADVALRRLYALGYPLAVVSNWDNSLPTVLEMFGWTSLFNIVVPSLVFGCEKPDPRIFHAALDHLGVDAGRAIHVGDNPIDDLEGARRAGMNAVLVDRSRSTTAPPYVKSLDDLETAFEWTF